MMARGLPPFFLRLRFATSMIATWLLNLNIFGFSLKSICSPGFNCHGCPWATAACPIGVMAYGSAVHALPVMAIATVLAVGAVLGRLVCSFACPFGLLQDLLHKLPGPKIGLPRFFRYGKYLALLLLVFVLPYALGFVHSGYLMVDKPVVNKSGAVGLAVNVTVTNPGAEPVVGPELAIIYTSLVSGEEVYREAKKFPYVTIPPGQKVELPPFEIPNRLAEANLIVDSPQSEVNQNPRYQLYYCKLCPAGTLTATIPADLSGKATSSIYSRMSGHILRLSILAAFLALMVISSRPFCRVFCPLGAIYAMTTPVSLATMRLDGRKCSECGRCNQVCPMGLDVRKEVGGMECIACGDCMKVCPEKGIERGFIFTTEARRHGEEAGATDEHG